MVARRGGGRGGGNGGGGDPGKPDDREEVPLIQWLVSGIAVLLVLGSFGLIAYDGYIARSGAPAISVAIDSIAHAGGLHTVHVTVRNEGGSAAADVQVSGVLEAGASPATTVLLDYLPAGSRESAAFVFAQDPRSAGLRVKVESWTEP